MDPPGVAVVIVTYNSADVLGGCLESLVEGGADGVLLTDVVVVDNASDDASTAIAKACHRLPVSVVPMVENTGYAAGLNAGVAALVSRPPDAVVLLNPDCRVRPGTLATLAAGLREPWCGIVAPRLVNLDGTLQPSLRRTPTVRGAFAEALLGGRAADRLGLGELVFAERAHALPGPVAWVTGAALLMSWSMLDRVGPWDESFLLYSEETEYMFRAADQDWSTWYEPAAVVEHKGGESSIRPSLFALLTVNRVALFKRRHGPLRGLAYAAGIALGTALRAAAGRATARAALGALLFPSRRITSLRQLT